MLSKTANKAKKEFASALEIIISLCHFSILSTGDNRSQSCLAIIVVSNLMYFYGINRNYETLHYITCTTAHDLGIHSYSALMSTKACLMELANLFESCEKGQICNG
jgi:hypothetical protein